MHAVVQIFPLKYLLDLVLHHQPGMGYFLSLVGIGGGIMSPDALGMLTHIIPLWTGLRGR